MINTTIYQLPDDRFRYDFSNQNQSVMIILISTEPLRRDTGINYIQTTCRALLDDVASNAIVPNRYTIVQNAESYLIRRDRQDDK